jgi:peptide/nickel transport system substrate-binding protein
MSMNNNQSVKPSTLTRRQMLRGMAAMAAAAVAGQFVSACAPPPAPAPSSGQPGAAVQPTAAAPTGPKKGGTLVTTANGELTFDPYFNIGTAGQSYHFFSSLFDYRGANPYEPNPQLAAKWEETDKTLTITIKQSVKFHNGREIVAQDIVDNIARAKDKSLGHYLFNAFDPSVDGAEATDKYTVKITYKKTYPVKLQDLAPLYIIPKEAMADVVRNPVGSGAFKFGGYTPGDKMELTPFADFWEKGKPYVDKVTVKIIADPQARLANLLSGSVDIIDRLPLSDVTRLKAEGKVQIVSSPPGGTWFANVLNCAKKPYDNKLVRQAINFSIDRDKINKLAYFDLAPITQTRYLPADPWYHEKADKFYKFDLQRAKQLLEQAGYGSGFKTSLAVSEAVLPGSKAMAQVWAQDLEKIGVKMEVIEREQAPFYDEYFAGNYEIQAYGLGDGLLDPATALAGNSATRLENNKANIQTLPNFAEYKKLVEEGTSSVDFKKRKPIYDKIQEMWAEEGYVIITAFWLSFTALSKRAKGYKIPGDRRPFLSDVWIDDKAS